MTRNAKLYKKEYDDLKDSIISDMWFLIKYRENATLNIMEEKGIPAIVTQTFDEQESETIDMVKVEENKVIAYASCGGYDMEMEYDLEDFEVPTLIVILDSVEKHIALEEKKK
jgi:cellulase/cellobiase CelA1